MRQATTFVDTTLRDGHQSLWATRMTTAMMLPIAPRMDEAGFKVVDLMGPVHFEACVRYLHENPWERIRLLVRAMPRTPISSWIRSKNLTSFNIVPDAVIALWIKQLAVNGIRRMVLFDALHDWDNIADSVSLARAEGAEIAVPLVFSLSPVHTDEFYARKTAEMVARLQPDVVIIKDSIGLLTPERTRTLVPVILEQIAGRPLEIHSHCTTGLAPLCCLEAVKLGVQTIHTCVAPLANGPSLPSAENMVVNLRRLGGRPAVDAEAVAAVSAHFTAVARREGKPLGAPVEYDVFQYQHQIPGGMITNLASMLAERRMAHRLEEVLEEVSRIREEWGYPVMITPFSQIVGTQAVLNVLIGERYQVATEEAIRYVLGHYGQPPAPVDPQVLDRLTGSAQGRRLLRWVQPQPSVQELRQESNRPGIADDELLLRFLFPAEHVNATLAAGPIKATYAALHKPVLHLLHELTRRKDIRYARVQKGEVAITLKRF